MSNVVRVDETEDLRDIAINTLGGLRDTCRCRQLPQSMTGVANVNMSPKESGRLDLAMSIDV